MEGLAVGTSLGSEESGKDRLAMLTLVVAASFAIMSLVIFAVRISSILEDSLYAQSTGGEGPGLYGIYKALNGEAVYQPLTDHPTTSQFNFLFYYGYGFVAKLFVSGSETLPIVARLLTLVGAFASLLVLLSYLWDKAKCLEGDRDALTVKALALLIPLIAYFGPFTGWWYLTARPDVMAVGCEAVGLVLFLRWAGQAPRASVVPPTLLFWLAWSLKQTVVFVWLGTLVVMGMRRQWKALATSLGIFLLLSMIPFLLFRWPYVEHTLFAPAVSWWSADHAIAIGRDAFMTGCFVYVPALLCIVHQVMNRKGSQALNILLIIFITALLGNILTSSKEGASRNYYFSSFLVGQLFIAQYVLTVWERRDGMARRLVMNILLLGVSLGLCVSSLYVMFPNQIGRINLLTDGERQEVKRVREIIIAADKPVLIAPSYYALPWNSGQYPSDVIDWGFYKRAEGASWVVSLKQRIGERYYAEALVYEGEWSHLLDRSGYKRLPPLGTLMHFVR